MNTYVIKAETLKQWQKEKENRVDKEKPLYLDLNI